MVTTTVSIRAAERGDVPALFGLIMELAQYEHLEEAVTGRAEALEDHLFGDRRYVEALVADIDQHMVGYALFFTSYSTFLTQPGLYLEDLYVQERYRGQGVGKALLKQVAHLVTERNYGRLEWSVLDWNESAIAFYETLGATMLPDWRICRVTGAALTTLASG